MKSLHIGFDAKRAFQNFTGLGNYSRNTLLALAEHAPELQLTLFTPRIRHAEFYKTITAFKQVKVVEYTGAFSAMWRSFSVVEQLKKQGVSVYHGLSNELPFGIAKAQIPSVVTVHDVLFKTQTSFQSVIDLTLYDIKVKAAVKQANQVVAISHYTAQELQKFYPLAQAKTRVIYQGIANRNLKNEVPLTAQELNILGIHKPFILQVGRMEVRKNIQLCLQALIELKARGDVPFQLVLVGRETYYTSSLKEFANNMQIAEHIVWLHDVEDPLLQRLYASCVMVAYPSLAEGFGLPVLEALLHQKPVVTNGEGCFKEVGGHLAYYVDAYDANALADIWLRHASGVHPNVEQIEPWIHQFAPEQMAAALREVYQTVL